MKTIKILHLIFLPMLAMSLPTAQTPLPKMDLHLQSLDGNPADIVGPSDVTPPAIPEDERVWGAQGRRREAWRVSDRQRFFAEEDKDFATRLSAVALDLDASQPADKRLFTLSERQVQQLETGSLTIPAVIKVDNIGDPTAPEIVQEFTFSDTDAPRSICTIPDQNKLIVVMANELRIYDYDNPPLFTLDPSPLGVAPIPTGMTVCSNTFQALFSAQVEQIQVPGGEETMALVAASINTVACAPPKPQAIGILVCNLANPSSPFFYTNLATQAWDPCRSEGPCEDWRVNGFDHVRTISMFPKDLVYAVGGAEIELTELDFTGVDNPAIGIVENATYSLNPLDELFSVAADPAAPASSDYLYVIGRHFAYAVDRAHLGSPGFFKQSSAGFGNGPAGGAQFMLADSGGAGPDTRELWTLAMQQARYVFRVTDFTQDGMAPLEFPDVSEGYYSAGPTDGAVANFTWQSAYTLTFGGVVRHDISGSEPVPAGYQPANVLGTEKDYTTEHLELVNFGTAGSPQWRLIATTAEGSFFAWPLDSTTHDPLPGAVYQPPVTIPPYWKAWTGGFIYGNDIATATIDGDKWVFVDLSNACGQGCVQEFGIGRYNWTDAIWAPAIYWEDPNPVGKIIPLAADLAVEGNRWLLVGAEGGFFVVDLLTGQVTDDVRTNSIDGLSFQTVAGIEKYGNRIFTSLADENHRFAFAMYAFDATTGHVYDPKTGLQSDIPIQTLYDGSDGMPDAFPGAFVNGGERMSLIEMSSSPKKLRLYSGTGNGTLLEIEWQASTDTMTPLSYWHNGGYFDHIASCDVYKIFSGIPGGASAFGPPLPFTLRIVVGKTRETFEIVSPPDLP